MAALGTGRSLIFQCPSCYAIMVDLRAASRAAGAAGREVKAGDGCLGCSTHCTPDVYIDTQLARLEALRDGASTLVSIPIRDLDANKRRAFTQVAHRHALTLHAGGSGHS